MYKPPENANRVKAIKNIFETSSSSASAGISNRHNFGNRSLKVKTFNNAISIDTNKSICNEFPSTNSSVHLSRQLSDPSKRNIKRTPAFRLDKSSVGNDVNKSPVSARLILKNRIKQFETQCQNSSSTKTSNENTDISCKQNVSSYLYTEPIPKNLRVKEIEPEIEHSYSNSIKLSHDIHNFETLKLGENVNNNVHGNNDDSVCDTLQRVAKLPLPPGPAPQKPPRTFTHSPKKLQDTNNDGEEIKSASNTSTLENIGKIKSDPKYMLDKLEFALRNNKIRRSRKSDESENGTVNKTKYNFDHVPLPDVSAINTVEKNIYTVPTTAATRSAVNTNINARSLTALNCLTSMGCTTRPYESIESSMSTFFVKSNSEEPLYAQPFEYQATSDEDKLHGSESGADASSISPVNVRRSVHYMSNPVPVGTMEDVDSTHQMSGSALEYPSASSSVSTSDFDSLTSTPTDNEHKIITTALNNKNIAVSNKIKDMIQAFEQKSDAPAVIVQNSRKLDLTKENNKIAERLQIFDGSEKCVPSNDSTDDDEFDSKNHSPNTTIRFCKYVKRVRSKIYWESTLKKLSPRLFHCCLLVGLNESTPYIKSKYPLHVEIPPKIEELCFPDFNCTPMGSDSTQCYSIVITNSVGDRMFGYCRRVLPEGCVTCLPLAYCILSSIKAAGFYAKVLVELESRHGLSDKVKNDFVSKLYRCPFPKPGETLRVDLSDLGGGVSGGDANKENRKHGTLVRTNGHIASDELSAMNDGNSDKKFLRILSHLNVGEGSENGVSDEKQSNGGMLVVEDEFPREIVLTRPCDSRYEDMDFSVLFNMLSVNILLKVFSSLLLERKVILVSNMLSTLSTCIEALQSMLYPFSWPHTLIPILPESLWEILEAPTPLLCGTLSPEVAQRYEFENGIIVDLDKSTVVKSVGDECKILPSRLVQHFRDGLDLAKAMPSMDSSQNVLVGDAFIRVFVHSCGHYKDHINGHVFNNDSFINEPKCHKTVRTFLKWFTETTMFNTFIESAARDSTAFTMFDSKIQIYTSEGSAPILKKMKNKSNKERKGSFF